MKEEGIKRTIQRLLKEIEEEDVGLSLLTTHYQSEQELDFFKKPDRFRVIDILQKLSEDSKQHKKMLENIIHLLEKKLHK